jgi:hypothetical protein
MKSEMKTLKAKVKSINVSASTAGVVPSAVQELREELAYAKVRRMKLKALLLRLFSPLFQLEHRFQKVLTRIRSRKMFDA